MNLVLFSNFVILVDCIKRQTKIYNIFLYNDNNKQMQYLHTSRKLPGGNFQKDSA